MSNLKKILALVLALVMSFSLVSVSSAAFEDADEVNAKYAEAVDVLAGLGVFNGRTATEFVPKANITRAEVAAIIYRVVTGDVKGKQVSIYADYNKFDDVNSAAWYAGYVNFCANAEYIKGVGNNKFAPEANVTGYQALAMVLRAVGYDKAGEFTGANWEIQTAAVAKKLGITKNVNDVTLGTIASREVVAELLFQTIAYVPQVSYTLALGYNDKDAIVGGDVNPTLGYQTFKLAFDENVLHDQWGRPYHVWYKDSTDVAKDAHLTTEYNKATEAVYAKMAYAPVASYTEAVTECDIAAELGFTSAKTISRLTVNGVVEEDCKVDAMADAKITPTATALTIGEQGRVTEIYYTSEYKYEIVMIDEFFAVVTDVTEVEYDRNGHIKEYAALVMNVFDNNNVPTEVVEYAATNWEYVVGDVLLINAETVGTSKNSRVTTDEDDQYIDFVGTPDVLEGAQTAFTNKASHIVNNTEYPDAVRFELDQAGVEVTKHNWFFDSFGNLIAVADIANIYSYGTITAIKWVDSNVDLTKGYALATITYMDGTSETTKVAKINGTTLYGVEGTGSSYADGLVSSTLQYNEAYTSAGVVKTERDFTNVALYRISESAAGLVLVDTTVLVNPAIETGVPAIADNMNAGNTTVFLVWDGVEYETITGIKNVPSFLGDEGYFWAADTNNNTVAEYVFISDADLVASTKNVTYYANPNSVLDVTTHLWSYGVYYYSIEGGYVNGEPQTIYVADYDMVQDLTATTKGQLLSMTIVDEFVASYDVVSDTPVKITSLNAWAVYAGAAHKSNSVTLDVVNGQDVLIIDGSAYDVEGTPVITYNKGLANTVNYDEDAFAYVIFTYGVNNSKNAQLIYITDVEGETGLETLTGADAVIAVLEKYDDVADITSEDDYQELKAALATAATFTEDNLTAAQWAAYTAAKADATTAEADYAAVKEARADRLAEIAANTKYADAAAATAAGVTGWTANWTTWTAGMISAAKDFVNNETDDSKLDDKTETLAAATAVQTAQTTEINKINPAIVAAVKAHDDYAMINTVKAIVDNDIKLDTAVAAYIEELTEEIEAMDDAGEIADVVTDEAANIAAVADAYLTAYVKGLTKAQRDTIAAKVDAIATIEAMSDPLKYATAADFAAIKTAIENGVDAVVAAVDEDAVVAAEAAAAVAVANAVLAANVDYINDGLTAGKLEVEANTVAGVVAALNELITSEVTVEVEQTAGTEYEVVVTTVLNGAVLDIVNLTVVEG